MPVCGENALQTGIFIWTKDLEKELKYLTDKH